MCLLGGSASRMRFFSSAEKPVTVLHLMCAGPEKKAKA